MKSQAIFNNVMLKKKLTTKIKSLFNKLITLEKKIDNQYLNSLSNAKNLITKILLITRQKKILISLYN